MRFQTPLALAAALSAAAARSVFPRQVPNAPQNVTTIKSPSGVTIRYKEHGNDGFCETTPGVNSYSGYIDVSPDVHVFFYFFESRRDPATDPVTLWLSGGPGSDSLIAAFEEIGPCEVLKNMTTVLRDHSWSDVTNLLFLSQPVGTGFSYSEKKVGRFSVMYEAVEDTGRDRKGEGRWAVADPTKQDTSRLAAVTAWELVQGFYSGLPQFDSKIKSTDFHLWTESFGGHWGPAFFTHFHEQNEKLDRNTTGRKLNMKSLGIVNGLVDERTQMEYLLRFTNENTYGLQLINETVYDHGDFALRRSRGCQDKLDDCAKLDRESLMGRVVCSEAHFVCKSDVEALYYQFGPDNRGYYDIRANPGDDVPPNFWRAWLNTAPVQDALGVDLNYTAANPIYTAFSLSGDIAAPYLPDLERLLEWDVQVSLVYGDADYICNWLGGEALSLAARWAGREGFLGAGYTNLTVDGVAYGETRQYGKLSFTRVWDAGHAVPFFQPAAAFQIFNRTSFGFDIATGELHVSPNSSYSTNGTNKTTHTNSVPPLPARTSSDMATGELHFSPNSS